jgi:hypothetical protein
MAWLGLPAWFERHPHLAASGFAWTLLRHIAAWHRIPVGDAIWHVRGPVLQTSDILAEEACDA